MLTSNLRYKQLIFVWSFGQLDSSSNSGHSWNIHEILLSSQISDKDFGNNDERIKFPKTITIEYNTWAPAFKNAAKEINKQYHIIH